MNATPWTRRDLVITVAITAVGCVLWAVGWYRVSGEPATAGQVSDLNLALLGLGLVGSANALWFLAGRRAVGIRRRLLLRAAQDPRGPVAAAPADRYVGTERFFHRPTCAMAGGRGWEGVARDEHLRSGRVACGVCAP